MYKKPPLTLQTTTLWDYPSQHYGSRMQGDKNYKGATPSYVIWNLLKRYTQEGAIVLDPMCGSGTTIDVAHDLNRQGLGFDVAPHRKDIGFADARDLPVKSETIDFVFVDPPYSTHLKYSGHAQCIGELDVDQPAYYEAMERVISEIYRVLKDQSYMALYVSDSYRADHPFGAIGFELFARLRQYFEPIDIVAVVRHNKTLQHSHWQKSAALGNYYLRGFNYLFIMKKNKAGKGAPVKLPSKAELPKAKPLPFNRPGKPRRKKKRRL